MRGGMLGSALSDPPPLQPTGKVDGRSLGCVLPPPAAAVPAAESVQSASFAAGSNEQTPTDVTRSERSELTQGSDPQQQAPARKSPIDPQSARDFVRQRKICVFGYKRTGKTSIVRQFAAGSFSHEHFLSINRSSSRQIERGGRQFLVHVLDTVGQDELGFFDPQYTIGTDGYILVYSVTDRESFKMVLEIYRELWAYTPLVPFVLVANKIDLGQERVVSKQEGRDLARQWGCPYAECTARSGHLVGRIFELLLTKVDGCYDDVPPPEPAAGPADARARGRNCVVQ